MNTVFHKMSIENFEDGYSNTEGSNYASVNEEQISENNKPTVDKPLTNVTLPFMYSFLKRKNFFGYTNKTILMYIIILLIIYYIISCK
jgi:hypothetical protein